MKKKIYTLLVLILCVTMVFTSCGMGGTSSNSSGSSDTAYTATQSGQGADKEVTVDEDEVKLETNIVSGDPSEVGPKSLKETVKDTVKGVFGKDGDEAQDVQAGQTAQSTQTGDSATSVTAVSTDSKDADKTSTADATIDANAVIGEAIKSKIESEEKQKEIEKASKSNVSSASDTTGYDENGDPDVPYDELNEEAFEDPDVKYADNAILIKFDKTFGGKLTKGLKKAGIGKLEYIFGTSEYSWYTGYILKKANLAETMENVRGMDNVITAEYNYVSEATADSSEAVQTVLANNPKTEDQDVLNSCGIKEAWATLEAKGISAGGSSDVVVAVIDTGVDYTHEDLYANMWRNLNEIEGDGIDNDGNGYVDDYYGIDMTTGKGSAMDDEGHGTHVAGIIAASNNNTGIVGLAYNTQIMAIKAGDTSGKFLESNVAKAIIYARENGADVINMSFGSIAPLAAVKDALENVYDSCILVASAGNDGNPNEATDYYAAAPNYPAAYSFVLGVMSVDSSNTESYFSNWDTNLYNSVEYEVYAPGEQILSTLPGDRYAKLSGTSMAAPVVAAEAALLRSYYKDTSKYPTKYIYGQIVGGTDKVTCINPQKHTVGGTQHNMPGVVNFGSAFDSVPTPDIKIDDYTIFDTAGFEQDTAEKNNGDGIIDAGETFALGFTLRNRWGKSKDTIVHIDANSATANIPDPYVTILNDEIDYGSVGTYSEIDSGKKKDNDIWVGWENPFYIQVKENCPNEHVVTINVKVTYKNGLNEEDETVYTTTGQAQFVVRRGVVLDTVIEKDMTLTSENYYIIQTGTTIAEGATVTVEPGTQIQFWCSDAEDAYAESGNAQLLVKGKFICNGTEKSPVEIFPSELMSNYRVTIFDVGSGYTELNYTNITNAYLLNGNLQTKGIDVASNCVFTQNTNDRLCYRYINNGQVQTSMSDGCIAISEAEECLFYKLSGNVRLYGKYDQCAFVDCQFEASYALDGFSHCVFYGNAAGEEGVGMVSSLVADENWNLSGGGAAYTTKDGKTYITIEDGSGEVFYEVKVPVYATDIKLDKYLVYMDMNSTYQIKAEVSPDNADPSELIYKSDNESIANVDSEGLITPVALGSTTVKVYSSDEAIYTQITVNVTETKPLESVTFTEDEVSLAVGESKQLSLTLAPDDATETEVVFTCDHPEIATVNNDGVVTACGAGDAVITVTAASTKDATKDETKDADTTREDATETNVAEVDTTKAGDGESSDDSIKDTITVHCLLAATGLKFEKDVYITNKEKDDGHDFYPVFSPEDTTDKELVWESSNPEICYVDEGGVLRKESTGVAELRARIKDTDYSATIQIIVTDNAVNSGVKKTCYDGTRFYALLDDGTLWIWSSVTKTIKQCTFDKVDYIKDFTYCNLNYNYVYVLDNSGDVYEYTMKNDGVHVGGTKKLSNIKSLSDCTWDRNSTCFAVTTDGNVYCWGYNASGQFGDGTTTDQLNSTSQMNISSKVVKVSRFTGSSSSLGSTLVLCEDKKVYFLGGNEKLTEPKLLFENAIDISASNSGDSYMGKKFVVEFEDKYALVYPSTGEKVTYEKKYSKEKHDGNYDAYIEEGNVYIRGQETYGQLGTGNTSPNSNGYYQMQGIENAVDVYFFTNNVMVECEDGVYILGKGTNYELGNGKAENSSTPVKLNFGLDELANNVTLQNWNHGESDTSESFTLSSKQIVLDFDRVISSGTSYANIGLNDSSNNTCFIYKEIDFDKLYITLKSDLTVGGIYTLTVPASALSNYSGKNNDAFTLTFTYLGENDGKTDAGKTEGDTQGSEPEDTSGQKDEEPKTSEDSEDEATNKLVVDEEKVKARTYPTIEDAQKIWEQYEADGRNTRFKGNAILNRLIDDNVNNWLRITGEQLYNYENKKINLGGNYWGTTNSTLIKKQILDYDTNQGLADIVEGKGLATAPSDIWPFVVDAYVMANGEKVDTVGNQEVTFVVEFNRPMDMSIPLVVKFGSAYPYSDYLVSGEYKTSTRWEGTITLNTLIENGYQKLSISNGKAVGTSMKLFTDWGRFQFKIDTMSAQSMNLQGEAKSDGIMLTWKQDDFETLAGYNIYRSTEEDRFYTKLNRSIISADESKWLDDTVDQGEQYYYCFTVVESDLTESEPSGKILVRAYDKMAPGISHSWVNSAFTNNKLMISATVRDNVAVDTVTLYYRITEKTEWTSLNMTHINDKYTVAIPAKDVTMAGLEYYICASDVTGNQTCKGSSEAPYIVTVYEAVSESSKGDVDGNGAVEVKDAMMLLLAANDRLILKADEFKRADLNGDEKLSADEALTILQYVNGTITSLKVS